MEDIKPSVGLYATRQYKYGVEKVIVQVLVRRSGDDYPTNPSCSYGEGLDGLRMEVSISDYDGKPYAEVCYRDKYAIDLRECGLMLAWLKNIDKLRRAADAREPGDVYAAFAKAIGAKWSTSNLAREEPSSNYSADRWLWNTVNDGRNELRRLVDAACKEQIERGISKKLAAD